MAIEDFFDHRCSIYHTQQESTSPGYGLPGSPKFKYPKSSAAKQGSNTPQVNRETSEGIT